MSDKKNVPKIRFPGFTEPGNSVSWGRLQHTEMEKHMRLIN